MTSCSEMRRLPLHAIAHGRAGDKGNVSNVSLVAYRPEAFQFLAKNVTAQKVHKIYAHLGASGVTRYDLPLLSAFNFVIDDVLDGGVNASRSIDRHGKTLSYILLGRFIIDMPMDLIPESSPYLDPDFRWQTY
ncbi:MAG: AtuA-related protein [Candidatus Puniceispirillaceae bacterium]